MRPSNPNGDPSVFPLGGTLGSEKDNRPRSSEAPAAK